jgi:cytochrome c peroxidase
MDLIGTKKHKRIVKAFLFTGSCGAVAILMFLLSNPAPQKNLTDTNEVDGSIAIGKMIYGFKPLSLNSDRSCLTCHGESGIPTSSKLSPKSTPSLIGSQHKQLFMIDGRYSSIRTVITANNWGHFKEMMGQEILAAVKKIPDEYKSVYKLQTPESLVPHLEKYINSFKVKPSAYDHFLAGEQKALSPQQQKGLRTFQRFGCHKCHSGQLLGGQARSFSPLAKRGAGLYQFTQLDVDQGVFLIPSLRSIKETAPYFHDRRAKELKEALEIKLNQFLYRRYSNSELDNLVQFLSVL